MSVPSAENEHHTLAGAETVSMTEAAAPPRARGLVETVLDLTEPGREEARARLDRFLGEPSPAGALRLWLLWSLGPHVRPERQQIVELLGRDVARLDAVLGRAVDAILHHPRFQKLEASWRGLHYLAEQAGEAESVKIRVLDVAWSELVKDLERAIEFDQSQLFRKVYSDEFDTPGGEPFSVLLGDYEIHPRPSREHPVDDVGALTAISHVAAAAFAPFIAGVHPSMFELEEFADLERPLNLPKTFEQLDYLKWRAFRDTEDARFVGLAMPRVLMRIPYTDDGSRVDRFLYSEDVAGPDRSKYLWGSAAYAFGAVLARAFGETGWLADIRGIERGVSGGGIAPGLPVHCFSTDRSGIAPKCSTDVVITDFQEQELSELGFIPLCHSADTELSVFYTNHSVQKPKVYDELPATMNARLSALLQYMLCVSRLSHYIKVAAREKIGAFSEPDECENFLHDWLQHYVTSDPEASADVKAEYPLREASVRVREHPGKPGCYLCIAHLWPHFQLDELSTSVKVTTELTPGRTA